MTSPRYLVADIGGTHTRVGVSDGAQVRRETIAKFVNADADSLLTLLRRFLNHCPEPQFSQACVAMAGPKLRGRIRLTNADWEIEPRQLGAALGIPRVHLVNDLQALGYALADLQPQQLLPLANCAAGENDIKNDEKSGNTHMVVGVGTGFNACAVSYSADNTPLPAASECGHASMPIATQDDLRLAEFIRARGAFASTEEVLSGRGLEAIYAWLNPPDPAHLSAAQIQAAATAPSPQPPAQQAVQILVRLLARVVGDLALTHLPFGGVYLSGGVCRGLASHLQHPQFAAAFTAKGRNASFLKRFPIYLLHDDFATLDGCARYLALKASDAH